MVDVFLLVVAIVVPFLLLAGNTYLMAHYMHPGDKEEAMWLKVLVVRRCHQRRAGHFGHGPARACFCVSMVPLARVAPANAELRAPGPQVLGFTFAECAVLLLPMDVVRDPRLTGHVVLHPAARRGRRRVCGRSGALRRQRVRA